jgi:hypothetical protein
MLNLIDSQINVLSCHASCSDVGSQQPNRYEVQEKEKIWTILGKGFPGFRIRQVEIVKR